MKAIEYARRLCKKIDAAKKEKSDLDFQKEIKAVLSDFVAEIFQEIKTEKIANNKKKVMQIINEKNNKFYSFMLRCNKIIESKNYSDLQTLFDAEVSKDILKTMAISADPELENFLKKD